MRDLIKNIVGIIKCKLNGITFSSKNIYVGFNTKIINRGSISISEYVSVHSCCYLYAHLSGSSIKFGKGVDIGSMSTISCMNKIHIGDDVLTGPHVFIADHNHEYKDIASPICKQGVRMKEGDEVIIKSGCWIGTNVVIAGNVHIGKNCVIGANSVVTKDIPDYSVAAGSPCKVIRKFNFETGEWERTNENPPLQ
jgi:acetyltransferase-like isoleucine patch superfamily enzyme